MYAILYNLHSILKDIRKQIPFESKYTIAPQIFTLRQILEKTQEKQIDTHHLLRFEIRFRHYT